MNTHQIVKVHRLACLLLLVLMSIGIVHAQSAYTVSPGGLGNIVTVLSNNAPRTADKFSFDTLPSVLKGKPLITINRGDLTKPGTSYSVEITSRSVVYLFAHDRGTPAIAGWEKTALTANWRSGNDTIYKKTVTPGLLTIPAHDGKDGDAYGIPHCIVIVEDAAQ